MHDLPEDQISPAAGRFWNGLTLGILATLAWMLAAGLWVQHRHAVPSLAEYKSVAANVAACRTPGLAAPEILHLNLCLDERYDSLLADWRTDTAVGVVLPPMFGWILALMGSLTRELGLFRRHPCP